MELDNRLQQKVENSSRPIYETSFTNIRETFRSEFGERRWIGEYLKAAGLRNESIPAKQDKPYQAARRSLERYESNRAGSSIYTQKQYTLTVGRTLPPIGRQADKTITVTVTGTQQGRERSFTATFKGMNAQTFVDNPTYRDIFYQYAIDVHADDPDSLADLLDGDDPDYGDSYGVEVSSVA